MFVFDDEDHVKSRQDGWHEVNILQVTNLTAVTIFTVPICHFVCHKMRCQTQCLTLEQNLVSTNIL